ncbi:MAG: alpha/beta hydrolase [Bacteroidales bacterium]|jgi:pimeloyl-ACP methyl ester carboxylesterase|nr:alpha/beta hydrolase [Bacteroidales bacterium]
MKTKHFTLLIVLVMIFHLRADAQNSVNEIVEEAISFSSNEATYNGTLSKPAGEGAFPLVILVSGMGLQDREWDFGAGKFKFAKIITDYLNQSGIAVYRYDDRGYGKSTGIPETLTSFYDLAEDVYAAAAMLNERKDIGKVGVLGHSLGGILSIIAASKHPDIDFIITLSGSYKSGGEIMMEQAISLKRWKTADEMTDKQVIETGQQFVRNWVSHSNGYDGLDTVKQILSDLLHYQIRSMSPELLAKNLEIYKDTTDFFQQEFEATLAYFTSPHQQSFAIYDPTEDFKKITCPVLILFGEKDEHVITETNMPKVAQALESASVTDLTIRIIPEADHAYTTEALFAKGEVVPGLLDFIANWISFRK